MYGKLANAVDVYNLEIERMETAAQKAWRFRHLESLGRRIARAALTRVVELVQTISSARQASAHSVSERLSC